MSSDRYKRYTSVSLGR